MKLNTPQHPPNNKCQPARQESVTKAKAAVAFASVTGINDVDYR